MKEFLDRLEETVPQKNSVVLSWLGQAGFLIKTGGGRIILIDPYLSDYANNALKRDNGQSFRRMTAPLFDPRRIKADILLVSHEHEDHLDMEAIPDLMANPGLEAYLNKPSIEKFRENRIIAGRLKEFHKKQIISFEDFELHIVDSDHGNLAPLAAGFILDFGFLKIYYSGDTAYNRERLEDVIDSGVDLALLPINGAYGNLNAVDAARFSADMKAASCIPHHFWTFPKHEAPMGTPAAALEAFPKYAPDCELWLATPGFLLSIGPKGTITEL